MDESFILRINRRNMAEGALEVTGVSRSGRVRKKSSKLVDYESLDELDVKSSKFKKDRQQEHGGRSFIQEEIFVEKPASDEEDILIESPGFKTEFGHSDESATELVFPTQDESSLESFGASELHELDACPMNPGTEAVGFQRIVEDDEGPSQSLYLMEKSKKKLVIKDGKIIGRSKPERKDKGKARFTPYMLWAKKIRAELSETNPDLDFSQRSKKLGQLWASVPFHEKYIWKRRAKRLAATKGTVKRETAAPRELVKKPKTSNKHFLNKQQNIEVASSSNISGMTVQTVNRSPAAPSRTSVTSGASEGFKPVGTTPLDVAAHLRLLGESLTIIGERLTEHEGQITVSGSVSVLLDSLLCALGPLMCLTQQVPELNVIPQQDLSKLMDNIAYIMPGL